MFAVSKQLLYFLLTVLIVLRLLLITISPRWRGPSLPVWARLLVSEAEYLGRALRFVLMMTELASDGLDVDNIGGKLHIRIVLGPLHLTLLLLLKAELILLADVLQLHLLQRGVFRDIGLSVKLCLGIISRERSPVFLFARLTPLNDGLNTEYMMITSVTARCAHVIPEVTLTLCYEFVKD